MPQLRSLLIAALLSTALATGVSAAPASDDPWLARLVGRFVLTGQIAGQKTTHDVEAEWVLNHLYVRIHEVSREKDAQGRPAYEAIVYVTRDTRPGEYAILWLDNTASGAFAPEGTGRAKPRGDTLPFVFKDARGRVSFMNVFAYDAKARTWSWAMDNIENGVAKPFGRVTLAPR